jgi:hypothetical protein
MLDDLVGAVEGRFAFRADLARCHGATVGAFVFAALIDVFGLGHGRCKLLLRVTGFPYYVKAQVDLRTAAHCNSGFA